ncbi:hypothetical protein L1987_30478 [Smallanthus sonchifolius]|uniref:Uncharacterized protein n=1 Tax=Smallanthus sonchifolius TaxID=185202 RepID=A0ACB9I5L1_9ASTR|nr:hypothetical protein L1987_30478 [Smallanthus sonchifolius]
MAKYFMKRRHDLSYNKTPCDEVEDMFILLKEGLKRFGYKRRIIFMFMVWKMEMNHIFWGWVGVGDYNGYKRFWITSLKWKFTDWKYNIFGIG